MLYISGRTILLESIYLLFRKGMGASTRAGRAGGLANSGIIDWLSRKVEKGGQILEGKNISDHGWLLKDSF